MAQTKTKKPTLPGRPTIRSQLLEIVVSRGLSAYAVARASGVDPGTVKRWMNGDRDIYFDTAAKICTALGVRLVELAHARPRGRGRRPVQPPP